ncbi:MAG: hypothetical protein R6V77_02645 [Candidatus Cloacimonadaceae bacterium]
MRRALTVIFIVLPAILLSSFFVTEPNVLSVNNIIFNLEPLVRIKIGENLYQILEFTSAVTENSGTYDITFSNSLLDLKVSISSANYFHSQCRQVQITAFYKQDLIIRDIALNLVFNQSDQISYLRGPEAINSGIADKNKNLYPYTDKVIEYKGIDSSFWLAGSGYAGCKGIEAIINNSVKLYDHTLHLARLYTPPNSTDRLIDLLPVTNNQTDNWSFLLFETRPVILAVNRWPDDRKAALAITNDADGENAPRLNAVYFGSSNPDSPAYLTKGLIANQIPVSNTVFGINISYLSNIWNDILSSGSTIGYHTYSGNPDLTNLTAQSLLNDMTDYNIRLWIDHGHNNENFAEMGTWQDSDFYILDVINQSGIDYAWIYDAPSTNPFNAFEDPWRLPHRLPFLQNLTRPVWFFGRTRMETWEYFNEFYMIDFKHLMTAANLDKLVLDNGLCIGYTHFCFANINTRHGFYYELPNGDYEVRDEFNDVLLMLNDYRRNKGLWIDTVENIFDRMLAIEQVQIKQIEDYGVPGLIRITLENRSDQDIAELTFNYGEYNHTIDLLAAGAQFSIVLSSSTQPTPDAALLPFMVSYFDKNLYIRSKENAVIPPLKVKIYNIKGQLVASAQTSESSNYLTLPFVNKASSIYFARIEAAGHLTQTSRFTVIK